MKKQRNARFLNTSHHILPLSRGDIMNPTVQQIKEIKRSVPTNSVDGVMVPGLYNGATRIPEKSIFAFSLFNAKTLVSQAINELEAYLNHEKKYNRREVKNVDGKMVKTINIPYEINYANVKLNKIASKLETAVKVGDSSPSTLLVLAGVYNLMGKVNKASKLCATLAFNGDKCQALYGSALTYTNIGIALQSQANSEAGRATDGAPTRVSIYNEKNGKNGKTEKVDAGTEKVKKKTISSSDLASLLQSLNRKVEYCYLQAYINETEAKKIAEVKNIYIPEVFFTILEHKVELQNKRFGAAPVIIAPTPVNKE